MFHKSQKTTRLLKYRGGIYFLSKNKIKKRIATHKNDVQCDDDDDDDVVRYQKRIGQ